MRKIWGFTTGLVTHGIYTTLSVNEQVAVVVVDTLCWIQYRIYDATHMQLYANFFATNLHVRFSCTFQRHERNSNVANKMPT